MMICYTYRLIFKTVKKSAGKIGLAVFMSAISAVCGFAQSLSLYVQPLSGTAASTTISAKKHSEAGSKESNANTIPSVGIPFGMTQWVAQTRTTEVKCQPPYYYKDSLLSGFRGTHWISGSCTQDYGSVTIVPVTGTLRTTVKEYSIPFAHEAETTGPSYYKLDLPAAGIIAELTGTARCGVLRFTMTRDDSLYLLVIPNSDFGKGAVKINNQEGIVEASNPVHRIYQGWGEEAGFKGWFYIQPMRKFTIQGVFTGNERSSDDSVSGKKEAGAYLGYYLKKGESLTVNIGTSFSNQQGARQNLRKEIGNRSFTMVEQSTRANWETELAKIRVAGKDEKAKRIFYTALYHAMQHPRLMSDVDGTYPRFAGKQQLEKMAWGNYYDDFSMWDTYRGQLPLLEIIDPSLTNALIRSLILKGQQGGWLPIFPCWNSYTAAMIGDHVAAFIAGAWNKGLRDYDVQAAYALIRRNAFESPDQYADYKNGMGRRALNSYMRFGYIPMEDSVQEAFHKKEQVSRTLEYAYDDYTVSLMAQGLNKPADYAALRERSFNYKNVFDPEVGMMRGRHETGRFADSFHPDIRESYITEGTPRQYTFYVPQDVNGLAGMMGGVKPFEKALDSLFLRGEYWHGNEPGHQIPFLYNYTASPWKTQREVSKLREEEYSDGPGGLSGNDDAGQMSAWYVFAAMGFYPVNPATGEYLLTTPLFDQVVIRAAGKSITVKTRMDKPGARYIHAVKWNGQLYTKNFINWKMIRSGGTLEILLSSTPTGWGSSPGARPFSLSKITGQ